MGDVGRREGGGASVQVGTGTSASRRRPYLRCNVRSPLRSNLQWWKIRENHVALTAVILQLIKGMAILTGGEGCSGLGTFFIPEMNFRAELLPLRVAVYHMSILKEIFKIQFSL